MAAFKETLERYRNSLTPEQKERRERFSKAEEDNTFLKFDDVTVDNKPLELKLYYQVYWKDDVLVERQDQLILSIAKRDYNFTQRFLVDMRKRIEENPQAKGFCFDMGPKAQYYETSKFVKLIEDCEAIVKERGLTMAEGY